MSLQRLVRLLLITSLLSAPMLGLVACTRPVTITTPAGHAAFTANEILIRVERLQNAAIAAHTQGALPLDTTRAIVFTTVQLAEVAEAATQGWQAAMKHVWAQAKQEQPALQPGGALAVVAAAVDAAVGGVQ